MDFRPEAASLEVFFVYVTQFPHALFEIEVAVVLLSLIPCLGCLHSLKVLCPLEYSPLDFSRFVRYLSQY